ncbi:MAG: RNA methyltransferase [Planctomycetaceae bacterium]|nr:MAG: RNA methyltransferase [Planctomycetaceae bacterium]
MAKLTSVQNPRIKQAVRLRNGRSRRRLGRMLIDGIREIHRAHRSGMSIIEVFWCPTGDRRPEQAQVLQALVDDHVSVFEVTEPVFEKLAFGQRSEGLVAVAQTPKWDLDRLDIPSEGLVAVLEGIEKPGNVGAVLRSADAAGVAAVILADEGTDLFNPNAIRASLGAIFSVPVATAPGRQVLDWLRHHGFSIYAAWLDGSKKYSQVNYGGRSAVILGSEAIGLSSLWRASDITQIRIPMQGVVDSLNVSATAAVLFYEALRQKTASSPYDIVRKPRP